MSITTPETVAETVGDVPTPLTITLDQMREAIDKAIALKGEEYRYKDDHDICLYFEGEDEEPSCAVGYAAVNLGIAEPVKAAILAWQRDEDVKPAGITMPSQPSAAQLFRYLQRLNGIEVDEEAAIFADQMQVSQDSGVSWGPARDSASVRLERRRQMRAASE
jgi:hypothetical protein